MRYLSQNVEPCLFHLRAAVSSHLLLLFSACNNNNNMLRATEFSTTAGSTAYTKSTKHGLNSESLDREAAAYIEVRTGSGLNPFHWVLQRLGV